MTKPKLNLTAAQREWRRWRFVLLAAVVLSGGWVAVAHFLEGMAERNAEAARLTAESAAVETAQFLKQDLQERLAPYRTITQRPELSTLLQSGDPDLLRAAERTLSEVAPGVLGIRLLPVGRLNVDYASSPPLTYASLEMVEASVQQGRVPAPEVQLMGTEDRHIAMLARVTDAQGQLVGHALIGIDVKLLQSALDAAPFSGGYLELRQPVAGMRPVVVAKRGVPVYSTGPEGPSLITRPVAGSRWVATYEPPMETLAPGFGSDDLIMWGGGATVLILALAAVLGFRTRPKAQAQGKALGGAIGTMGKDAGRPAADMVDAYLNRSEEGVTPEVLSQDEATEALADSDAKEEPASPAIEVSATIFRKYDIRGVVGETLTAEVARAIGQAVGTAADRNNQSAICVGRDGRTSSRELAEALMDGLGETGREVVDIGQVPTPVLYYATHYLETGSGVMVTGSHNPAQYNGFKILVGGKTLAGKEITALRDLIESSQLSSGLGVHRTMDLGPEYIRQVSEDIPVALGNPYKVVIDCGNGVAGELAPRLYRALGHDVVELYCDINGEFPNHHPDPSQPENLQDLIAAVTKEEADLGLAFDADGDRLCLVDNQGNIIWPDRMMMLYSQDVLTNNPGAKIVYDVKCTRELPRFIKKLGGEPILSETGHSLVKAKMTETGAQLAGEMTGHICFSDRWYGFDDALYAGARLLEILRQTGGTVADAFKTLPAGLSTPEIRVNMAEGEPGRFMERFSKAAQFDGADVITLDGMRVEYPDGWALVRASNTMPSLVLRFEANDENALQRIQETVKKAMLEVERSLSLPF